MVGVTNGFSVICVRREETTCKAGRNNLLWQYNGIGMIIKSTIGEAILSVPLCLDA